MRTTPTTSRHRPILPSEVRGNAFSEREKMVLTHAYNSRLARVLMDERGLTPAQIAQNAGIHERTVLRYLGRSGADNTSDPRTSTTVLIFKALGYNLVLRSHRSVQ